MRIQQRLSQQMRPVKLFRDYTKHAEGSVLITMGDTHVLCTASIVPGVPKFLKGSGKGWVTAEYGMLPRSTHQRMDREASRGKQSGRTLEIQRLIGRSLRAAVDLTALSENTITIDCDVLQADGGTRTAAITGGCVALYDAIKKFCKSNTLIKNPFVQWVAAISVGIFEEIPVLDLDYHEDSQASMDMNVVMNERGEWIELQGTAEKSPFTQLELLNLLELSSLGIQQLIALQKAVVDEN